MNRDYLKFDLAICEEKKQFQEHFISKVEPKPVDDMTGNILFGSGLFNVRVSELSKDTQETIKRLVLNDMKNSLVITKQYIEDTKIKLKKY